MASLQPSGRPGHCQRAGPAQRSLKPTLHAPICTHAGYLQGRPRAGHPARAARLLQVWPAAWARALEPRSTTTATPGPTVPSPPSLHAPRQPPHTHPALHNPRPLAPWPRAALCRLISGMHSSITAHVVNDYLIDEATMTWGPNLEMFKWRLGNPAVKDRCAGGNPPPPHTHHPLAGGKWPMSPPSTGSRLVLL